MSETSEPKDKRVITPMTETMVAAITDYRFMHRCESQADAVRRLVQIGLDSAKSEKLKKPK